MSENKIMKLTFSDFYLKNRCFNFSNEILHKITYMGK